MAQKKNHTPARELLFGNLWEFDPAPESASPNIDSRYDLFINGKTVAPRSGKYFASTSPRNGEKLADIAEASAADVDAAYAAASQAFPKWSRLPGAERGKYLFRIARLLQDRSREFAVAETLDGGKMISTCRWRPPTFSTMPDGRTNSSTSPPAGKRPQSASWGR